MVATPHGFHCAWRIGFGIAGDPLIPRGQGTDTTGYPLPLAASIARSLATSIVLKPRSVVGHGVKPVPPVLQLVQQLRRLAAPKENAA
jgi:hypothetical protein